MEPIKLNNSFITEVSPCYIIAEAGVNHDGKLEKAIELVQEAKKVGADCVKFQTFKAERVVTSTAPKAHYQLKVTDEKQSQFDMLKSLELNDADYEVLIAEATQLGIDIMSTPYAIEDIDFLTKVGISAFKVASGQIVELSFLRYLASKGLPILLSTGMSTMAEVSAAIQVIRDEGNNQLIVLQCTTNYPSKMDEANILAMTTIGKGHKVYVGYSDHVPENYACYAAVSLGARIVEKHFTLDRNSSGPDHSSSLDPAQFQELVLGIKSIEKSLGSGIKEPSNQELQNIGGMRRSITAKHRISKGHIITERDLCFKRPASGLSPSLIELFIGKKAMKDIDEDTFLNFSLVK